MRQGTSNVRQVSNLRASLTFPFSCSERLKKMRQHFHAARRGSQSAYQAKTATPDCNQRVRVHKRAPPFQTVHSKSRLLRRTTRDIARGKRRPKNPRRAPRLSRA